MEYDYYPVKRHADHNRILNGKVWCIQVCRENFNSICFELSRFWFQDICGVICAAMTWFLIAYAEFVVMKVMLLPSPFPVYRYVNMIVFNTGIFLAVSSHLKSMFSDPGAVPKGTATKENIQQLGLREGDVIYKCPKCASIKPSRAHHCSVCKRFVERLEKHSTVYSPFVHQQVHSENGSSLVSLSAPAPY